MNYRVQNFIESHLAMIDAANWKDVYKIFKEDYASEYSDIGLLTDVLINAGIDLLEDIEGVFDHMFCGSKMTMIKLPLNIKRIGADAFSHCSYLEEIYIPKSVSTISFHAFEDTGLQSNPLKIIYAGTQDEWNAIHKWQSWDTDSFLKIIYLNGEVNS